MRSPDTKIRTDVTKQPSPSLVNAWIVAGIISSGARFIPIPLVDDLVRRQCRKFIVSRTLISAPSPTTLADLGPMYTEDRSYFLGCVGSVARLPFKLLLFPIRKVVALVTSFRGIPMEILRMVLMGRTIQRHASGKSVSSREAVAMRTAFDRSMLRMDWRLANTIFANVVGRARGWRAAAINDARRIGENEGLFEIADESSEQVKGLAWQLQKRLKEPPLLQLFEQFDQEFDETFRSVLAES